uniref:Uncharacterized protein n=1 Tax=Romanomermis culicivorax TaxID=13658 RepID=A0A915KYF6_ROMCU
MDKNRRKTHIKRVGKSSSKAHFAEHAPNAALQPNITAGVAAEATTVPNVKPARSGGNLMTPSYLTCPISKRAGIVASNEGKVKALGVSNYMIKHLEEMDEYAKIKPICFNKFLAYLEK